MFGVHYSVHANKIDAYVYLTFIYYCLYMDFLPIAKLSKQSNCKIIRQQHGH